MEADNKIIRKLKTTILQSKRGIWNKRRNYQHTSRIMFYS